MYRQIKHNKVNCFYKTCFTISINSNINLYIFCHKQFLCLNAYYQTINFITLSKNFYSLGGVGGWKDYFTVRQSEEWDKLVEEQLKSTEVEFKYTI